MITPIAKIAFNIRYEGNAFFKAANIKYSDVINKNTLFKSFFIFVFKT